MKNRISEYHPELEQIAKRIPRFSFSRRNLWLFRVLDKLLSRGKPPQDILVENTYIPSHDDAAQIRLRMYRARSQVVSPVPVLVWLHGGGYILGGPERDDHCCFQYVRELGIVVISVDYRHAPEHPFPTPLEDSHSALKWVESNAGELGVDRSRIAVGGESAGAGLAAALAQLAHDRKEIEPVFQLLVYPMLDDRTAIRPDIADGAHLLWDQASNRFGWESYLGRECGAIDAPAYSVPARRTDLAGLPPVWIGVGTLDLFYDEDVVYAQRLKEWGVECETYLVPGAFHGFDVVAPKSQVARDFRSAQIEALKKHLCAS